MHRLLTNRAMIGIASQHRSGTICQTHKTMDKLAEWIRAEFQSIVVRYETVQEERGFLTLISYDSYVGKSWF